MKPNILSSLFTGEMDPSEFDNRPYPNNDVWEWTSMGKVVKNKPVTYRCMQINSTGRKWKIFSKKAFLKNQKKDFQVHYEAHSCNIEQNITDLNITPSSSNIPSPQNNTLPLNPNSNQISRSPNSSILLPKISRLSSNLSSSSNSFNPTSHSSSSQLSSTPTKVRPTSSSNLSQYLIDNDYREKNIEGDGHCLFRSLAHKVKGDQEKYKEIRKEISTEGLNNVDKYCKLAEYFLVKTRNNQSYKDLFIQHMNEIKSSARLYGCNIELVIASQLYDIDIFKLFVNNKSELTFDVFLANKDLPIEKEFLMLHFEATVEHYSVLENLNGRKRPKLTSSDSIRSWIQKDGVGKFVALGAKTEKVFK